MNKFRIAANLDEYNECSCLSCSGQFISNDIIMYNFCPLCGIKFDGEFNIRNKRYNLSKPYDYRNPGYTTEKGLIVKSDRPRLVIEEIDKYSTSLSPDGFFQVTHEPRMRYHLHSHSEMNGLDSELNKSTFSGMITRYTKLVKENRSVRFILVDERGRKIIKQHLV